MKPAYLFLEYFGEGGTVGQLDEPHNLLHAPLQRVALQNEHVFWLLFYLLQGRGEKESQNCVSSSRDKSTA